MAKSILERREDLCMNGLRNMIDYRDIRLARTQTSAVSEHADKFGHYPLWDEVKFLTETHIGTLVGLKKPFTLDFTLAISIGIAELKFQKGGCLRFNSTTADRYHSGLVRERLLVRTMRIEILQSLTTIVRIEIHQSQTATVLLIMRHSQSTSSPDEDQQ